MIRKHVAQHAHEAVTPTLRMLRYWWVRLNAEVFDNILLPCQLSYGETPGENVYGMCYPLEVERVRIHIDRQADTRGCMLATMAHEMIHQWQHQHGLEMTHGDVFKGWAEVVRVKTGLTV